MAEDIVERARQEAATDTPLVHYGPLLTELADEITRLRTALAASEADNVRLREALAWYGESPTPGKWLIVDGSDRTFISDMADWGERARQALAATGRMEGMIVISSEPFDEAIWQICNYHRRNMHVDQCERCTDQRYCRAFAKEYIEQSIRAMLVAHSGE